MPQVKITLPPGVEVDRPRLTSAVRLALQGTDPSKIWRLNPIPMVAQLEEGVFREGLNDLADLYEEVITGLELPPDLQAQAVIRKALEAPGALGRPTTETALLAPEQPLLQPDEAEEVCQDLRKAFGFREEQHPRAEAGAAGFRPGEFVPKGTGSGQGSAADPTQEYQQRHPETGAGFDNRMSPARGDSMSWERKWPAGRQMLEAECAEKGLPPGTRDYSPQEHEWYRNIEDLGDNFFMAGPETNPHIRAEAALMKARVEDRFPEWIRNRLEQQGVKVIFTAASPLRARFTSQDAFYDWVRENPRMANSMGPDTCPGMFLRKSNHVLAQIGYSSPGPGVPIGSVNLEGHEYAHAVDQNIRDDGTPVSKTPEWEEIVGEMAPHLDEYSRKSDELFAEGLNCYLESPQLRKQMEEGPPGWQKMARFFHDLLQGQSGEDKVRKGLRSEGGRPGAGPLNLPDGYRWRTLDLPQPDGETIHLDGWGPADAPK